MFEVKIDIANQSHSRCERVSPNLKVQSGGRGKNPVLPKQQLQDFTFLLLLLGRQMFQPNSSHKSSARMPGGSRLHQPRHCISSGILHAPSGTSTLDSQGRGIDEPGGVALLDPYSGEWHWLINNWMGLAFNSPNDVITDRQGALWFTDPAYGHHQVSSGCRWNKPI